MLTTVLLLAFLSGAAAQCTGADHPNCASWKTNGYCTNTGSPLEHRKLYCGVTCGLCNADGTQTAAGGGSSVPACVDTNPNCATWQAQTPKFCENPAYSTAMKKQHCCKSCSAPANPTTACAVIYNGSTELNTPKTTMQTALSLLPPLTKVFVKSGCTLKMYDNPIGMPTQVAGSPYSGTDAFVTLAGPAATGSMAFECTCP